MGDTILDWNVPNWITITLMAAIGVGFLFAIQAIVLKNRNGGGALATS